MGGRNGGEMEKTSLETEANGKKSRSVKTPRKDSGETTKARGKGQKKAAAKKTRESRKEGDEEDRKGKSARAQKRRCATRCREK